MDLRVVVLFKCSAFRMPHRLKESQQFLPWIPTESFSVGASSFTPLLFLVFSLESDLAFGISFWVTYGIR